MSNRSVSVQPSTTTQLMRLSNCHVIAAALSCIFAGWYKIRKIIKILKLNYKCRTNNTSPIPPTSPTCLPHPPLPPLPHIYFANMLHTQTTLTTWHLTRQLLVLSRYLSQCLPRRVCLRHFLSASAPRTHHTTSSIGIALYRSPAQESSYSAAQDSNPP